MAAIGVARVPCPHCGGLLELQLKVIQSRREVGALVTITPDRAALDREIAEHVRDHH